MRITKEKVIMKIVAQVWMLVLFIGSLLFFSRLVILPVIFSIVFFFHFINHWFVLLDGKLKFICLWLIVQNQLFGDVILNWHFIPIPLIIFNDWIYIIF